ncbi:hypothetical protein GLOTRDRAFT_112937 [Gloeophyllum trabeum ATCC 11539]|uniref:Uncharacterized protein n=1 Tax=Gloeophyllum trabeum (strain ATCC 11539 / FP-39264 / Madison 617) TaxID=670483 RepID=S7QKF2_GLOTA|nr:uncharacterized protein GLOTRDRAFT_112937 [Gloeophyllum trabeum ATCC 11539]EPQ60241.1 hypothetical protein GLOTRDRAFT_112937 [Gloeophyllum trabeum ATCC 11539]
MQECGTPDVPSFTALRALQTRLTKNVGLKTEAHTSSLENHFYMNDPIQLFAMDWANPLVREHMNLYPEITSNVSEAWQAGKWANSNDIDLLSPMWANRQNAPHRHYFIKEVARLRSGKLVIPIRWVRQEGVMCADFIERVHASELESNYLDLTSGEGLQFSFSEAAPAWTREMPHPVRRIANGRHAFTLFVTPWSDDVSGNVSKQYNPHVNLYLANSTLPHQKLAQEFFIRFASTSQHASSSEQLDALSGKMKPDAWYPAYDCELREEIIFRILPYTFPADNPQQSETCSHVGVHGNLFCRRCKIGGTAEERETCEGYRALFKPGAARTPVETVQLIEEQLWAACLGVQETLEELHTTTGVKDKISLFWIDKCIMRARAIQKQRLGKDSPDCDMRLKDRHLKGDARKAVRNEILCAIQREVYDWLVTQPEARYNMLPADSLTAKRKALRPGDHYNPCLAMTGVDIHADTPVEILHTYLLGQDKYVWYATHSSWDDKKQELFALRLHSSAVDGLGLPPIRAQYIVQYKNNLIGRHFKVLQQLGIFHLHGDLCSSLMFDMWRATGDLGAYLWYHQISDMETYLADVEILIENVLDIWALIDPARIIQKPKLHVLPHIIDDIRRFGPSLLFATEIFECWNAIFRLCSVLSNRQAPSHDIAATLADMERFKHQVSGGWWKGDTGEYVQAGRNVREFLQRNKKLQRRLGWVDKSLASLQPGSITLLPKAKQSKATWSEVLDISTLSSLAEPTPAGRLWQPSRYCISRSRDVCRPGSWVFYRMAQSDNVACGRIRNILVADSDVLSGPSDSYTAASIIIESFHISSVLHERLRMPVLMRVSNEHGPAIVPVEALDILFLFNAQHDCAAGGCSPTGWRGLQQERRSTNVLDKCIVHEDDNQFILNMHALHNAALLRDVLPRSLTAPRRYLHDRLSKLDEIAKGLQVSGPAKRAQSAAKAAETRARNKKAKEAQNLAQATVEMAGDSVVDNATM